MTAAATVTASTTVTATATTTATATASATATATAAAATAANVAVWDGFRLVKGTRRFYERPQPSECLRWRAEGKRSGGGGWG